MPIREKDGQVHRREPKKTYDTQEGGIATLEVRTSQRLWAFPYAHFLYSCFNPSKDLEINFVGHQIIVSGLNLHILHQALTSISLKMIEPTGKTVEAASEQEVQIESIELLSLSETIGLNESDE